MDFVTPLLGLLVPHLPGLLRKTAEDVVGEGAKNVVFAPVPTELKAIWAKLMPKVEADAVADQPDDEDPLEILKLALEGIEKSEPQLNGNVEGIRGNSDCIALSLLIGAIS